MPAARLIAMVGILCALGLAAGPANVAFATGEIEVPEEAAAAEGAKKVWKASRPVILNDANARYPDAGHMKRRDPVWRAWTADQPPIRQEIRDRKRGFVEERIAEPDKSVAALR